MGRNLPKGGSAGPAVRSPSGGAAGRRLGGQAVLDGTLMIARAFAETYRDVFDAPVPEPLVAILRQMEIGVDRDRGRPFRGQSLTVPEGPPYVHGPVQSVGHR